MKKRIIWGVITFIIAALSIWAVFSMSGKITPKELIESVSGPSGIWIIPALLASVGFIFFEGCAFLSILRAIGYPRSIGDGFLYSSADFYFSAITPSASGGQPASAFFMMSHGIPGALVTAAIILNVIIYSLVLFVLSIVCIIINPWLFMGFSTFAKLLILYGCVVLLVMCVLFYMLLRRQSLIFTIANKFLGFLKKIRILKNMDHLIERLNKSSKEYASCVEVIMAHRILPLKVFIFNLLQRLSQFFIIIFVYLAIGGAPSKLLDLFVTQDLVTIGSFGIPIPGAMGATEYLMINGYGSLMPRDDAFRLELLGRGLSFYICMIVSIIAVVIGYILIRRKKNSPNPTAPLSDNQ